MGAMSPFFLVATFAIFCFVFMALSAITFLVSLAVPGTRKYALSAALWCAVWGPCLVAWFVFGALAGIANYGLQQAAHGPALPQAWLRGLGVGLGLLALFSTAAVATVISWLHQAAIRRMTFALFRLYATVVCAGTGSVYGWALAIAAGSRGMDVALPVSIAALAILTVAFGYLGFRTARQLRGKAPHRFTWITPEEFEGVPAATENLSTNFR